MILGLSPSTFVVLHVVLSLVGLATGIAALIGMLGSRVLPGITALFLLSTLATSMTGFFFPFTGVGIGHVTGVLSLAVLVPTLVALCVHRLAGHWRWIYVAGATTALWLNGVIAIFQAYAKIAYLQPLAGTPAVMATQAVVFVTLALIGSLAAAVFEPCETWPCLQDFTAAASPPS